MTRTPNEAIALARNQSDHGPRFRVGLCKRKTRELYGVASDGSEDATEAWKRTDHRYGVPPADAPRGALIWWTGGSDGHGHVAVATGDGSCWSVDIKRTGYWDRVPIRYIAERWSALHLAGSSADIDGVRVVPPLTRIARARRKYNQDRVLDLGLLDDALKAGRGKKVRAFRDAVDQLARDFFTDVRR